MQVQLTFKELSLRVVTKVEALSLLVPEGTYDGRVCVHTHG